jgi:glycosyltransferase involved in cell wall biosynthesis
MKKRVLIVQRVITNYRFELLQELAHFVEQLDFITSQGDTQGTLKSYTPKSIKYNNIKIHKLNALKLGYKGDSRSTSLFFYPQVLKLLKNYDVIILEGTTNLPNNIFIVPYAKLLGKRILWWDAGYSLEKRTFKRKIIDNIVYLFIKMTDTQLAYSTKAKKYMEKYMGAKNCHLLLNTINTEYFDSIQSEIKNNLENYKFNENNIKLLYVGVIEERKKVLELIQLIDKMNQNLHKYSLTIIGGGEYLSFLQEYVKKNKIVGIEFTGAIYDKSELKKYYFNADLFILPGDGGLGVLQALLYGLPTLCMTADGTEEDYMSSKAIIRNLEDIENINIKGLRDSFNYEDFYKKVNSKYYIKFFLEVINA